MPKKNRVKPEHRTERDSAGSRAARCSAAVRKLRAENKTLREVLREDNRKLWEHHESSLCTWWGQCPVCSNQNKESYPNNIFGRIEKALRSDEEKQPNAKLMDAAPEPSHSTGVTD